MGFEQSWNLMKGSRNIYDFKVGLVKKRGSCQGLRHLFSKVFSGCPASRTCQWVRKKQNIADLTVPLTHQLRKKNTFNWSSAKSLLVRVPP